MSEIRADAPFQPRQIPAAADVGEQADPGFGHREARMFGRDAIFRRLRKRRRRRLAVMPSMKVTTGFA